MVEFSKMLMLWNEQNEREMPWKGIKDPYRIWLSEVILQQTRVEQGLPYYLKFTSNFPTINDLAAATEDEVLKLWQGLGYYTRARNMLKTAKYISQELGGIFPDGYEGLLKLKGVGEYTAAAIASFAYNAPVAVVDGNVNRVLSRYFGIYTPVNSTEGKKEFMALAQDLLDRKEPGIYNQAIMDLGATICLPKNPKCPTCPFSNTCKAFIENRTAQLPIKEKKLKRRKRYFNFLILQEQENIYIERRQGKDIWHGLHQFPLIESTGKTSMKRLQASDEWKDIFQGNEQPDILDVSKWEKQILTHQDIFARFIILKTKNISRSNLIKVDQGNIYNFAFPKIIDCYLKDKTLYLALADNIIK